MVCLYVIGCGDAIKIGIADDPARRLKQLQTANPTPLTLEHEHVFPTRSAAANAEYEAHQRCRRFLRSGEWYDRAALPVLQALLPPRDSLLTLRSLRARCRDADTAAMLDRGIAALERETES